MRQVVEVVKRISCMIGCFGLNSVRAEDYKSGALTGPGNSTAPVISYALLHYTVVVPILLLTICNCCIKTFDAFLATTVATLGGTRLARGRRESEVMPT